MRSAIVVVALAATFAGNLRVAAQGGARPPDIAGEWRLDSAEDPGQPPLADYLGLALNEAGRLRADTTPESIWGTPEYQCRPHSAPHQWRGVGGARILKDLDPISREIIGYRVAVHALARSADLRGRPSASAGLGAAQLERILDRRVDRSDAEGHDHALEGRLPEARWAADVATC